jgi:hypothetical protein
MPTQRFLSAAFLTTIALAWPDLAGAQIKQPGNHPRYTVELEPHLLVQHSDDWYANDEGYGVGIRASIPLLHNGPISTINNSLALGFGADLSFFDRCRGARNDDCDARMLWLPVVGQWNFFFTPVVSVFGELGLSIVHRSADWETGCLGDDDCDDTDLDLFRPLFFGGGRFLFSRSVGMVVRLGTPYVSLGATFLL